MTLPICALQVPPGGSLGEVLTELLKGNGCAGNAERQSGHTGALSLFSPQGCLKFTF